MAATLDVGPIPHAPLAALSFTTTEQGLLLPFLRCAVMGFGLDLCPLAGGPCASLGQHVLKGAG